MVIGVGVTLLVVGMLMLILVVRGDIRMERGQFELRALEQAKYISVSVTEAAVVGDYATIRQMLRARVEDALLDEVVWIDNTGHRITESMVDKGYRTPEWFRGVVALSPAQAVSKVEVGGVKYGDLIVKLSPEQVIFRVYDRFIIGVEATMFAMLVFLGLITVITTSALRPLRELEAAAKEIGNGNYHVHVEPKGSAEVRRTIGAFNTMAAQVEHLLGQIRHLAGRMEESREELNKSVARELHDSLGGNLTMLKLGLETLSDKAKHDQEKIQTLVELTDSTIQLVRGLTSALRPSMLDSLGMMPTLKWYAEEFSRMTGIQCHIDIPADSDFAKEHKASLFRVFQEALTNVARHAEATRVSISVSEMDGRLVVEIEDNGKGFPPEMVDGMVRENSFGIIGMRERVQYMQGVLEIISAPTRGTTVTVSVPL